MPKAVLMPFEEMVWVGEKALQHGDIGNVTHFRQEGDAVMAVYQGMLQRGEVPY